MNIDRLVEHITKPLLNEGVNDPGIFKAIFLAGGPGSGKSYVAQQLFGIPERVNISISGLKMVNQDKELETLLKKYYGSVDLANMPDELFADLTGADKTGKPVTSYGKGVTKPFLEVRNILRGIERRDVEYLLERALSGDALESLNDGAGRASRLKRPLTKLVNAAHASEDGKNLLAFMCALEPDPFITDVIFQVFDPNSKFAKRATGQTTKRPSGSASQRFGSTVDLSRAEINRLRGILQNTDNMIVASWRDILFNI